MSDSEEPPRYVADEEPSVVEALWAVTASSDPHSITHPVTRAAADMVKGSTHPADLVQGLCVLSRLVHGGYWEAVAQSGAVPYVLQYATADRTERPVREAATVVAYQLLMASEEASRLVCALTRPEELPVWLRRGAGSTRRVGALLTIRYASAGDGEADAALRSGVVSALVDGLSAPDKPPGTREVTRNAIDAVCYPRKTPREAADVADALPALVRCADLAPTHRGDLDPRLRTLENIGSLLAHATPAHVALALEAGVRPLTAPVAPEEAPVLLDAVAHLAGCLARGNVAQKRQLCESGLVEDVLEMCALPGAPIHDLANTLAALSTDAQDPAAAAAIFETLVCPPLMKKLAASNDPQPWRVTQALGREPHSVGSACAFTIAKLLTASPACRDPLVHAGLATLLLDLLCDPISSAVTVSETTNALTCACTIPPPPPPEMICEVLEGLLAASLLHASITNIANKCHSSFAAIRRIVDCFKDDPARAGAALRAGVVREVLAIADAEPHKMTADMLEALGSMARGVPAVARAVAEAGVLPALCRMLGAAAEQHASGNAGDVDRVTAVAAALLSEPARAAVCQDLVLAQLRACCSPPKRPWRLWRWVRAVGVALGLARSPYATLSGAAQVVLRATQVSTTLRDAMLQGGVLAELVKSTEDPRLPPAVGKRVSAAVTALTSPDTHLRTPPPPSVVRAALPELETIAASQSACAALAHNCVAELTNLTSGSLTGSAGQSPAAGETQEV